MEALVGSSSKATITLFSLPLQKNSGFSSLNNSSLKFQNGYSFFAPILSNKLQFRSSKKRSLMVEARKSDDKKKKNDSHSFAPKPDEATGPFPEAVLLKQKKVQKDGRVLPEFSDEEEEELFESLNLQLESDFNVDEMRHYEVVYLVHQDYKEKIEDVNSKIQDFIREKKGRVWRFSDWGMRRLAYKIKKTTHAHYILINFELGGQWINEFKQMLDQDERVIRHLVIKRDKAITEDCPPPPEFHTLRADMVDEYEVDDDVDDDDEDEEWYDDDDEEEEEDDADSEDASSKNVFEGTDNQKVEVTGKETLELEKALR